MQFPSAWPSWVKNLEESIHSRRSRGHCRWSQRNSCEQNAISTWEHFLSRAPYHPHIGLEGGAYWRCAAASCWAAWNRSTKPVELCKSARCSRWELNSVKTVIILLAIFVYILLTQFWDTFCLKYILLWWWMFKQLFLTCIFSQCWDFFITFL